MNALPALIRQASSTSQVAILPTPLFSASIACAIFNNRSISARPKNKGRIGGLCLSAQSQSLCAREVLAGARVNLDDLAFLHEQRHAYDGAGLERGRFAATARCIALQARVGLHDLERDGVRRFDR